ncbi:hypothetical protein KEM56_006662 [Ascosphaera pollenicola]|nr:hypothetical protein KEM56_006662 [Ascosphaera pollenicola]
MDMQYDQSITPGPVTNGASGQTPAITQGAQNPPATLNGNASNDYNGDDNMDMDTDIDIDLGPDPGTEYLETEPALTTVYPSEQHQTGAETVPSNEDANPEKVHIRGVDDLTTDNITNFANEHFAEESPTRIEWIDDTSANIVYSSAEVGLRALAALSQEEPGSDGQPDQSLRLRLAKALSSHPDSVLQIRTAVATDRKKARAHEASRFYLLHPEYDPRERPRAPRRRNHSRRYDQDEDDEGYNRRRFDAKEHRRRVDIANDQDLTANMYDDDVDMEGETRRRRHRGRSTSPTNSRRDDDTSNNFRDRSPRSRRNRERDDERARNSGKELFSQPSSQPKELFPTSPSDGDHGSGTSFLKGNTAAVSKHRRSIAFDAADSTVDLSRRVSTPDSTTKRGDKGVELFPEYSSADSERLRIRGAFGNNGNNSGLSIKGAASASVRELFPSKYNPNEGKELFSDKIQGRGGRRRRAEDMFS